MVRIDLLKEFGADRLAAVDIKDAYKFLVALAGKGPYCASFPNCWPCCVKISKVYFDSNGESSGSKKRKHAIKEAKECLGTTSCNDHKEDPDLFGDNNNEPANKEPKIN